jgi:predicted transcriptional regulator
MKAKKGDNPAPLGGRPSGYTEELADKICDAIAGSSKGLNHHCKELGISPSMVYRWLEKNEGFRERYARAREDQADFVADEIVEIADDNSRDAEYYVGGNHVQRAKLRVDARKWVASKLKPKKYGEKLDLTTGGDKLQPMIIDWTGQHNSTDSQAEGGTPDPQ